MTIIDGFLESISKVTDKLFEDGWIGTLGIIILSIIFLYVLYKLVTG